VRRTDISGDVAVVAEPGDTDGGPNFEIVTRGDPLFALRRGDSRQFAGVGLVGGDRWFGGG